MGVQSPASGCPFYFLSQVQESRRAPPAVGQRLWRCVGCTQGPGAGPSRAIEPPERSVTVSTVEE